MVRVGRGAQTQDAASYYVYAFAVYGYLYAYQAYLAYLGDGVA